MDHASLSNATFSLVQIGRSSRMAQLDAEPAYERGFLPCPKNSVTGIVCLDDHPNASTF